MMKRCTVTVSKRSNWIWAELFDLDCLRWKDDRKDIWRSHYSKSRERSLQPTKKSVRNVNSQSARLWAGERRGEKSSQKSSPPYQKTRTVPIKSSIHPLKNYRIILINFGTSKILRNLARLALHRNIRMKRTTLIYMI
jgi:hypothetical protein